MSVVALLAEIDNLGGTVDGEKLGACETAGDVLDLVGLGR